MSLDDPGPCIVLCTSGAVVLDGLSLTPGHAAFVAADVPTTMAGEGVAFIAAVGDG